MAAGEHPFHRRARPLPSEVTAPWKSTVLKDATGSGTTCGTKKKLKSQNCTGAIQHRKLRPAHAQRSCRTGTPTATCTRIMQNTVAEVQLKKYGKSSLLNTARSRFENFRPVYRPTK